MAARKTTASSEQEIAVRLELTKEFLRIEQFNEMETALQLTIIDAFVNYVLKGK